MDSYSTGIIGMAQPDLARRAGIAEPMLLRLWCVSLGVLSFLALPSVQGTVPAYLFGLASIPLCVVRFRFSDAARLEAYVRDWILLGAIWGFFFIVSQTNHFFFSSEVIPGFAYISGGKTMLFRSSMFTQSLYLLACFGTFVFFRHWPSSQLQKLIFLGAWLVALYGIYEWLFYLLTGQTGDFIVNRKFEGAEGELHTGSWSQVMTVAGIRMLRIKSTLGEPSFFSAVGVPFMFLAFFKKRYWLTLALGFCVLFSWSTSAYAGVFFSLVIGAVFMKQYRGPFFVALGIGAIFMIGLIAVAPDTVMSMTLDKVQGISDSGDVRKDLSEARDQGEAMLNVAHWLFGLGYGYCFSSAYDAIKINMGYVGLLLFCVLFLFPFVRSVYEGRADSAHFAFAALVVFLLYRINVAEFYLPSVWAILGLAWRRGDADSDESGFGTMDADERMLGDFGYGDA